jgi:hypothetical protein
MTQLKTQKIVIFTLFIIIVSTFFVLQTPCVSSEPLNQTNITAYGGNTTLLNLDLSQNSHLWQGFFGNINGGIKLANAENENFYDWTIVSAKGEVLATRYIVDDWSHINCTNQTEIYQEEERLSILNESSDGINDTYMNTTHPIFDVAGKLISGCRATLTDNSTDIRVVFWNILLNANATTTVYTGLMDNDVIGFNGTAVDFQLLVPVDRLAGYAVYYIYIELD